MARTSRRALPGEQPAATGSREVRLTTAGSAPPEATIGTVEDDLGWRLIHIYGLTETVAGKVQTYVLRGRYREDEERMISG